MAIKAEDIIAVIAAEAGVDAASLRPDATLTDLDISSLDIASAVFELEDRFGVAIEPDSISPTSTIADFVDHVMSLAAG